MGDLPISKNTIKKKCVAILMQRGKRDMGVFCFLEVANDSGCHDKFQNRICNVPLHEYNLSLQFETAFWFS